MPARSNAAASRIGESGWAFRSLGALYNETYDDKWLQSRKFAQYYYPIFYYYHTIIKAGMNI